MKIFIAIKFHSKVCSSMFFVSLPPAILSLVMVYIQEDLDSWMDINTLYTIFWFYRIVTFKQIDSSY